VDRTGDVQTAAYIAAYALTAKQVPKKLIATGVPSSSTDPSKKDP